MRLNKVALVVAVVYNLINFFFWEQIKEMPDATSMIFILIYPSFWIITIILVTVLCVKKKWLKNYSKTSTYIALFFCTPIFFLVIARTELPESYCESSGYASKNGYTFKYEEWVYNPKYVQVIKYWKAKKENCNSCDTSEFKRDSTWIYFDQKRDTMKIEVYKNGKLITVKKKQ